jgi:hypothetical protein
MSEAKIHDTERDSSFDKLIVKNMADVEIVERIKQILEVPVCSWRAWVQENINLSADYLISLLKEQKWRIEDDWKRNIVRKNDKKALIKLLDSIKKYEMPERK